MYIRPFSQQTSINKSTSSNSWWNFVLNFFVILGVEIVKNVFESILTITTSPVTTIFLHYFIDLGTSMLEDLILGNDPLNTFNLTTSAFFPTFKLANQVVRARKLERGYLRTIGKVGEKEYKKQFFQLQNELNKNTIYENMNVRNYKKIQEKFLKENPKLLNIDNYIFSPKLKISQLKQNQIIFRKKYNIFFANPIKYFNKSISMLNDPSFFTRNFVAWSTKRVKRHINKHLIEWYKKARKTLTIFTKENKLIHKMLIPLNHTSSPDPQTGNYWIIGIRYDHMPGAFHLYWMRIIFDSKITKHKKPVYKYNLRFDEILKFIQAPSAGRYYIDNFCFGWQIGKIIRNSGAYHLGSVITSNIPIITRTMRLTYSLYTNVDKLIDLLNDRNALKNLQEKWSFTKSNVKKEIMGMGRGLLQGIKGGNVLKTTIDFFKSNNRSAYIKKNAFNFSKRKVRKSIKKINTNLLSKKRKW